LVSSGFPEFDWIFGEALWYFKRISLVVWRAVDCVAPTADEEAFEDSSKLAKRNMFSQAKVTKKEHTERMSWSDYGEHSR
jgi:hypothetical protein